MIDTEDDDELDDMTEEDHQFWGELMTGMRGEMLFLGGLPASVSETMGRAAGDRGEVRFLVERTWDRADAPNGAWILGRGRAGYLAGETMSLSILDACWLELSPTAAYSRRWAYVVPGMSLIHKECEPLGQFAVSVHQQTGKRSGNKIERDEYQVEFVGSVLGAMAYGFVWENLDKTPPKPNESAGPYRVTIGPNLSLCTCTAGNCKLDICKHRSASYAAIAAGLVDGATPWRGMPESLEVVEHDSTYAPEKKSEAEPLGAEADRPSRQVGRPQPDGCRKEDRRQPADLGRLGIEHHPVEADSNVDRTAPQRVTKEKMQELHNAS